MSTSSNEAGASAAAQAAGRSASSWRLVIMAIFPRVVAGNISFTYFNLYPLLMIHRLKGISSAYLQVIRRLLFGCLRGDARLVKILVASERARTEALGHMMDRDYCRGIMRLTLSA
jgi:hypothetical protein